VKPSRGPSAARLHLSSVLERARDEPPEERPRQAGGRVSQRKASRSTLDEDPTIPGGLFHRTSGRQVLVWLDGCDTLATEMNR